MEQRRPYTDYKRQIIYRYKRFGALNCRPLITQNAFGNSDNILDVPSFTKII